MTALLTLVLADLPFLALAGAGLAGMGAALGWRLTRAARLRRRAAHAASTSAGRWTRHSRSAWRCQATARGKSSSSASAAAKVSSMDQQPQSRAPAASSAKRVATSPQRAPSSGVVAIIQAASFRLQAKTGSIRAEATNCLAASLQRPARA